MPTPLRLRAERNYVVRFGKCLQTRGIRGESKLPVAHGETRARIERPYDRIVPPHQSSTIDPFRRGQPKGCPTRKLEKTSSGSHPMFRILLTTPVCFSIFF